MQIIPVFMAVFCLFLVHVHGAAKTTQEPELEKYTIAPGEAIKAADSHATIDKARRSANEEVMLDPKEVTATIFPGDLNEDNNASSHKLRTRGRLGRRRRCADSAPWICEGVTCFNKFSYMCCQGGHICEYPSVCLKNAVGQMVCKR